VFFGSYCEKWSFESGFLTLCLSMPGKWGFWYPFPVNGHTSPLIMPAVFYAKRYRLKAIAPMNKWSVVSFRPILTDLPLQNNPAQEERHKYRQTVERTGTPFKNAHK